MHLRSKLTSEISQKIGSSNGKEVQNCFKVGTLPPFFFQKNANQFYVVKISVPTNFICL